MKQEIRLVFKEDERLENIIQECYFKKGDRGKIGGSEYNFIVDESTDIYDDLKKLNNSTFKLENHSIMCGFLRCLVKVEDGVVRVYPISTYCMPCNGDVYDFY